MIYKVEKVPSVVSVLRGHLRSFDTPLHALWQKCVRRLSLVRVDILLYGTNRVLLCGDGVWLFSVYGAVYQ